MDRVQRFAKKVCRDGDRAFIGNKKGDKFRKGELFPYPVDSYCLPVLCINQSKEDILPYYENARTLVHTNILYPSTIAWEGVSGQGPEVCYENKNDMLGLESYCKSKHAKGLFDEHSENATFRARLRDAATGICFIHSQNFSHGNIHLDSFCIARDGNLAKLHILEGIKDNLTREEMLQDWRDFVVAIETLFNILNKKMSYLLDDYLKRLKSGSLLLEKENYALDHPVYWSHSRTKAFYLMFHERRNNMKDDLVKLNWPKNFPSRFLDRKDKTPYNQFSFMEFSTMIRGKILHYKRNETSVIEHVPPPLLMSMLEVFMSGKYEKLHDW